MGGQYELHREARLCTMLDSSGKSRVKRTLQPLSGSAHPAIISARILAPWLVGNDENGAFCGYLPTTSFQERGSEGSWGKKFDRKFAITNTDNLYISG